MEFETICSIIGSVLLALWLCWVVYWAVEVILR